MTTPEIPKVKAPERPLPKSFRIKPTDHTALTPEQREEIIDANALLDGIDAWQAWQRVLKNPRLTIKNILDQDPRIEVLKPFSRNTHSEYAAHSLDAIRRDMATLVSLQKFDDLPEEIVRKQLMEPGITDNLLQDKEMGNLITLLIQKITDDIDPDLQAQVLDQGIDITSNDFNAKTLIQLAKQRFRNKLQQSRKFALGKAGNPADLANPINLMLPPDKAIESASVIAGEFDVLHHEIGHSIATLANILDTVNLADKSKHDIETGDEPFATKEIENRIYEELDSLMEEAQMLLGTSLHPEDTDASMVTVDSLYTDVRRTLGKALIGTNIKVNELAASSGVTATSIVWSKVMWRLLAKNIAQNTLRASNDINNPNPTLELSSMEGSISEILGSDLDGKDFLTSLQMNPERKYYVIFFDDNNGGFDEDIVQHGFRKGKTTWKTQQGTGIGMAFHADYLKKQGGILIPLNRKNAHGDILGARVAIALPVAE